MVSFHGNHFVIAELSFATSGQKVGINNYGVDRKMQAYIPGAHISTPHTRNTYLASIRKHLDNKETKKKITDTLVELADKFRI